MKQLILGFFFLAVAGTETNAKPIAILENSLSGNRTLTADSCYVLRGVYVVNDNAVLTINPGVEIRCEEGSSLVVMQGGQIFSNGTSSQPVIFSPYQDPGLLTPGFWGGMLINGKALNNVIDGGGGTFDIERGGISYPGGGLIDNDNSGSITYTHILYAGGGDIGDEETHGLVLNGVGSGTTISHIQVAYSALDGIVLFGGKVNMFNAYVLNAYRNDLFLNLGYTGEISGVLTMRKDPAAHHPNGSYGMLIWNNEEALTNTPLTNVKVDQSSFLGPLMCNSEPISSDFQHGIMFDHNAAGDIINSVVAYYNGYGLYINDTRSAFNTHEDDLNVSFTSFSNNGIGEYSYNSTDIDWNTDGCDDNMDKWIGFSPGTALCIETGNQFNVSNIGYHNSFCGAYCDELFEANFILTEETELDAPSSNSILEDRGAVQFDDRFAWVEICPEDQAYCIPDLLKKASLKPKIQIVPNPAQNQAYLLFEAGIKGNANIVVFDKVTGRTLYQKNVHIDHIGQQRILFSVQGLMEGVYTIRVEMKDQVLHGKISVN